MRSTRLGTLLSSLLLAGIALLTAAPAVGQEGEADGHRLRSGFWLSGGIGGGLYENGEEGASGYFRLGGTLSRHFLLGGEVTILTHGADVVRAPGSELTNSNVTASLLLYPSDRGGFFLKTGLGVATRQIDVEAGGVSTSASESGVGVTLGVGHDIQLGDGNLFLTPNLDVLLQSYVGTEAIDHALTLLTVGVGFR